MLTAICSTRTLHHTSSICATARSVCKFPIQLLPTRMPIWNRTAKKLGESPCPNFFKQSEENPTIPKLLSHFYQNEFPFIHLNSAYIKENELSILFLFSRIAEMPSAKICLTAQSSSFYIGNRIELFHPSEAAINEVADLIVPGRRENSPCEVTIVANFQKPNVFKALLRLFKNARMNVDFTVSIVKP